jgi:hypothetical protein
VTFDFIVKLSKTHRGNDGICVFVHKLTKLVHFVACKEELSAKKNAELYVDHVFCLPGLSREFITDRDVCFTSAFWQEVTVFLGTRLLCLLLSIRKLTAKWKESIRLWRRIYDILSL